MSAHTEQRRQRLPVPVKIQAELTSQVISVKTSAGSGSQDMADSEMRSSGVPRAIPSLVDWRGRTFHPLDSNEIHWNPLTFFWVPRVD